MTTMCCICRRVEEEGAWKSSAECTCRGQLSHGYCPTCFAAVMEETREYFAAKRILVNTTAKAATTARLEICG